MTDMNSARNRVAVWLANQALRLASPRYRKFIRGLILIGMDSAARDLTRESPKVACEHAYTVQGQTYTCAEPRGHACHWNAARSAMWTDRA